MHRPFTGRVLALVVAAACGPAADVAPEGTAIGSVHDVVVEVSPERPPTALAGDELVAHVGRVLGVAGRFWDLAPSELAGWHVVLHGPRTVPCGPAREAGGCAYLHAHRLAVAEDPDWPYEPASALLHEVGHAALFLRGDPSADAGHADARWSRLGEAWAELLAAH